MNDYLAVIGYACLDQDFLNRLLELGAGAVPLYPRTSNAVLTADDVAHLNEFKNAPNTPELAAAWAEAGENIRTVCGNPPCIVYFGDVAAV